MHRHRQLGFRACAALGARAAWLCAASLFGQAMAALPAADTVMALQVQQFALDAAQHQAPGRRVVVQVGALDPRLRLAPCERTQPYLAGTQRLWGRSRVGVRCVQGASAWNVFLPVSVKVYGIAAVAAAPLQAGTVLAATDLSQAEVDLAENVSNALTDPAHAIGRTLLRAIVAGQTLRESHLRPRVWFAAGDEVRLVARGNGFHAVSTGQALTLGIEGQLARARTDSGRVVVGSPVGRREIELTQ